MLFFLSTFLTIFYDELRLLLSLAFEVLTSVNRVISALRSMLRVWYLFKRVDTKRKSSTFDLAIPIKRMILKDSSSVLLKEGSVEVLVCSSSIML